MSTPGTSCGGIFTVRIDAQRPNTASLVGELDMVGVGLFLDTLAQIDGDVDVDCSELEFIDAAGLRALLDARNRCASRGAQLVVVNPRPFLLRLLKIVELDTLLDIRNGAEL